MAAYSTPKVQLVADTTGANLQALGLEDMELSELVQTLVGRAEADVAQQVTEALFDSPDLTTRQALVIQESVCWGAAARFLGIVRLRKADGTYVPLLVEDSRAIGEIIADFMAEQNRLAAVALGGEGSVIVQIKSTFNADTDAELQFNRGRVW